MKTCLIYGHNGLDLDVTFNLVAFYKKIGFTTVFSENLFDADLLVVIRAVDKPVDLSKHKFSVVHVFDYGGWGYDKFVTSINPAISFIFTTSETTKKHLINDLNFPSEHVFVALPPVDIAIWSHKVEEVKYQIVHIGNFKPITEKDNFKERFNEIIGHSKVHVWGLGWQLVEHLYHGKTGVFDVSNIYSHSKYALGLMYPFQREVTFSGRFWHGPLNGCSVFSEAGLYSQKMPGVIETDYSIVDIEKKIKNNVDRIALQREAQIFWINKYNETLKFVLPTLINIKSKGFNFKSVFIFLNISVNNILKEYYQKLSIFKLIKSR